MNLSKEADGTVGRGRAKLYLSPSGGLANRLMGLVSCLRLSKIHNRDLWLEWPNSYVMKCSPDDLFGKELPGWSGVGMLSHIRDDDRHHIDASTIADGKNRPVIDFNMHVGRDIFVSTNCFLADSREDRDSTFHNYSPSVLSVGQIFDELGQSDAVCARLSQFKRRFGSLRDVLGVHIRRGPQDPDAKPYFDLITNADYLELIEHLAPSGRVLLATDDEATREEMADHLGERLIMYTPYSYDRGGQASATQDAFVEFLLLSECASVVGIAWSTFSYFATQLRCIPYIEVIYGKKGPAGRVTYKRHEYLDGENRFNHRVKDVEI